MIGRPAGSGSAVLAATLSKAGNGCTRVELACGNRAASISDVIALGLAPRVRSRHGAGHGDHTPVPHPALAGPA